jgi:SapC protein
VANLVVLKSELHRHLRVDNTPSVRYGDNVNNVAVVPREFPALLAHFPIFFRKSAETGQFEPMILLGFHPGENLFLVNDRWDAAYVPVQIQRRPFSVLKSMVATGDGPGRLEIAVDVDDPRVRVDAGKSVFLEDGQPTEFLRQVSSMLIALVEGATEAYAYTGRLTELSLIEPIRVDVTFVDGSEVKLQGLYSISPSILKALPAQHLVELRDRGFLEWMYFQMASIAHVAALVARKNRLLSGVTPRNGLI